MAIWLTILLTLLPKLLEFLLDLLKKKQNVPARYLARMDNVVWYADQIRSTAAKTGCATGGVPPEEG